ncbi:hypothetical protein [Saccharibacillus alkalitolerans]|uniref:hypothetical protein n=1 Tax=Saccharibacillus alkalitolerans TaxID=2705290 RepID=UPI001F33A4B9|nr:hypothetical protein [Saccharibacillus alkalitolerans]
MSNLHVVQLEAKPGLLIAVVEEERREGSASRRVEIPIAPASAKQRADWQRLAEHSALGLYRLLGEAGELTIRPGGDEKPGRSRPARRAVEGGGEADAEDRRTEAGSGTASGSGEGGGTAARADGAEIPSARTQLTFDGGEAAWEMTAAQAGGGPEVPAALAAAAEAVRTHPAFGLTLAGIDPGELAGAALAAWSDGWAAAPDEAAPKSAPRAAAEGGGREIAEWIASAAEKGVLHEHGRLPDEPAAAEAALPGPGDLSLLPDSAPAEAALSELRRAMRVRMGGSL